MKNLLGNFLSILLIFLCFSCSQKAAPTADRSKTFYNKNNSLSSKKYRDSVDRKSGPQQVKVGIGDTLFSLSRKYQVPLRDLIKQNDLVAPYNVKVGTTLIIPAPIYHEVKPGETIYAISRSYNMKIDSLIEMNDLVAPYNVIAGQLIRIEKFGTGTNNSVATTAPSTPSNNVVVADIKPAPHTLVDKNEKREAAAKEVKEEKKSEVGIVAQTLDKFNHFSWPARGPIVSKFGPKQGGLYNDGVNIKAKEGSEVKSSEDGVVAYVGNELKGYGNLVIIKHSGGWITAYAHLAHSGVTRGQKVAKGQKIGTVGATGNVNSPQLYFGLRKGRDAVNPEHYLK